MKPGNKVIIKFEWPNEPNYGEIATLLEEQWPGFWLLRVDKTGEKVRFNQHWLHYTTNEVTIEDIHERSLFQRIVGGVSSAWERFMWGPKGV